MLQKHLISCLFGAVLAAFLSAMAPTISYMLASAHGLQVVGLCSSFGAKTLAIPSRGQPTDSEHAPVFKRCQFCLASQGAAVAPALAHEIGLPNLADYRGAPVVFVWNPAIWRDAHPRAPPAIGA